jgi:hypothetical protein
MTYDLFSYSMCVVCEWHSLVIKTCSLSCRNGTLARVFAMPSRHPLAGSFCRGLALWNFEWHAFNLNGNGTGVKREWHIIYFCVPAISTSCGRVVWKLFGPSLGWKDMSTATLCSTCRRCLHTKNFIARYIFLIYTRILPPQILQFLKVVPAFSYTGTRIKENTPAMLDALD